MNNNMVQITHDIFPHLAYLGPGGAISAVGALVAAVAGIFLALFGFVWYPVRRLLKSRIRRAERVQDLEN